MNFHFFFFFTFVENLVILQKKKENIFFEKKFRKHIYIAVKWMEDGENRISFIKDVKITDGEIDAMYSALV